MKIAKRIIKIVLIILAVLLSLLLINFIPALSLKTSDMNVFAGEWINVYYEDEAEAAEDVFRYADEETGKIAKALGSREKESVNVYIYDHQEVMQRKKYGFIAPLLGLDWYIGDNIGTNVILTSPANPGKVHDYDNNKYAVLHEIVHAYISVRNPDISLWLTEGMALYLSNGEEFHRDFLEYMTIPTFEDTCSKNPIRFADCGGYTFAHTYIAYLEEYYGWDQVLELIKTEDYEACFGKTQKEIYGEWIRYLENGYQ